MHFFLSGGAAPDFLIAFVRVTLGVFFVLARFRWFWDPSRSPSCWFNPARHQHLAQRLCTCGYGLHPFLSGLVACIEVSAGFALIFGLLSTLATMGLTGVLLFGTWCTARTKVLEQNPVDPVDCVSCYLWRVEGIYLAMAFGLLFSGPGRFSLDYALGLL